MDNLEQQARNRVENSPVLAPFADIIFSDWHEGAEHLAWVASADEGEIVGWAEGIRETEQQEANA